MKNNEVNTEQEDEKLNEMQKDCMEQNSSADMSSSTALHSNWPVPDG